jgi:predicted amidophosphoribosyltransferase
MPLTLPDAPCAQCLDSGLPPFDRIASLGVLEGPLKSAVHRAKYEHRWPLAERLADRLLERPDVKLILEEAEVLVPVPLHRKRQRERGYNQAEVIARRLCSKFNVFHSPARKGGDRSANHAASLLDPRPSGLGYQRFVTSNRLTVARAAIRVRPTETQTHLHTRAGRIENLKGAFVMENADAIADKQIVLIDDVLTTGATLVSLARVLKPAKPASICAIVLAVADPKGRAFEMI